MVLRWIAAPILGLAATSGAWAAVANEPWLGAPFTAEPRALLEAATRVDAAGASIVVLTEEGTQILDGAGARTYRYRTVYRVLRQEAVDGWASLEAEWSPWHEARPDLRARVVTADGRAHELDPATVAESGVGESSDDVYSDRRRLQAPLPAVAVGAVVEYAITWRENTPPVPVGRNGSFLFGSGVPVRRVRFVIDAPTNLPVRYAVRLLPGLVPVRTEPAAGRMRLVFEAGPFEPLGPIEPNMPSEEPRRPYVAYSTGRSWTEVASAYARIVDARLADASLAEPVREATTGARGSADVVSRLLARVRRELRYTGIEFGSAAIVPQTPAEVRKRGYGDCKDQAALLVAFLRAAGIPAHVALLSTGPGADVDPQLPGLGVFDHAIVYVPGPPEVWIDPTDPYAAAGELPIADQGRLALVARPDTTGLVRTPESRAADNTVLETREFRLSGSGKARVVETTELRGGFARSYRSDYAATKPERLKERLSGYVKEEYLGELVSHEHSDPAVLEAPFRVRLELRDATRGSTDETTAVVALRPAGLTDELPEALRKESDEKARSREYVLPMPFVCERRYRIFPPPGFAAGPLPEERDVALGPARYTQRFALLKDGAVEAVLRFDSGKGRLAAEEYEALRKGVRELRAEPFTFVRFPQTGEAHLQAGRIREALAEFRSLAARTPGSAEPHTRMARALLAGALGEAARAEARRAVDLEPGSSAAHQTLGWVLQHDAVGRRFERGFDLEGAIAAYRRAKQLDPQDGVVRADLAILLEHDAEGVRYSPRARLGEAAAEYRALRSELAERRFDDNLLICLMWAGAFEELLREVRPLEATPLHDALRVLGVAAISGADAALQEATRSIAEPEARRRAIESAGGSLVQLRRYALASRLIAESAKGAPNAAALNAQADLLSRVRPFEELTFDPADPATLPRRLLVALARPGPTTVDTLFVARQPTTPERERAEIASMIDAARRQARARGTPWEAAVDAALALMRVEKDGNDALGLRLRVTLGGPQPVKERFYAVREASEPRLVGSSHALVDVALEALRRADAGDLAGARQWLDWAREELQAPGGDDPLAGPPFVRLWQAGQQGSASEIRRAAAALMIANETHAPSAVRLLEAGRREATSDGVRSGCDLALALAHLFSDRWADLLAVTERLPSPAASLSAFRLRRAALVGLERWRDLERLADERLAARPGDPQARGALAIAASLGRRDLARASQIRRQLDAEGHAEADDLNELAWNALFLQEPLDPAIAVARRAVDMSQRRSAGILHTLASLYAQAERSAEARETILEALKLANDGQPASADWWVFGRLAESYGLSDTATTLYGRVERSARGGRPEPPESTWLLAQLRLAQLAKAGSIRR
jgi:transglutaminase-like putative cysteine protease/tetratricopeptide (TPR) repeat protein